MFASAADENSFKLSATANELSTGKDRTNETNILADSYLHRVLSRKEVAGTASRRKRSTKGRAPKRPLVCIPCKKRFNRRSKLDQHNRLVHNTDVRYSCDGCQKTFSRQDHIARHVRNGHCPGHAGPSTTAAELSANADDVPLLAELSMLVLLTSEPQWLATDWFTAK